MSEETQTPIPPPFPEKIYAFHGKVYGDKLSRFYAMTLDEIPVEYNGTPVVVYVKNGEATLRIKRELTHE